jgi:putative flippase GtrA
LGNIKDILKPQVMKFVLVGGVCACADFVSFNLLIDQLHVKYLVSNVISISLAIGLNYLLSRAFVFKKSKYSRKKEIFSFVFFSLLALILNQFVLWLLVEAVKFDVRLCKVLAIIIVAFFNYTTKKHVVFKT